MKFPDFSFSVIRQFRHVKLLVLIFLICVAYLSAINRAQSLPWVMAALLSATLVTGVLWPHWLVKHLSVGRKGPDRAEEGNTIIFHVEVENHGWLPRFMIELVDRLPFVGAATGAIGHGDKTLGVVAYVPGGSTRHFEVALVCEKRGFYRLGPVAVASSFPLGLVVAHRRRSDGVQTLTIYPKIFPIMALPLRGASSQIHRGGYLLPEGAGAAEFCGLREYRRGDNPRHVHWPTTARLNALMVKEFEPLASACLYVALDQAADANVGRGRESTFEYAVRIAASVAKYAGDNGIPIRLVGQGRQSIRIPGGVGEHHYQCILDELAVVDADGAIPYARVLDQMMLDCQHGETLLIFLSEPEARLMDTLQTLAVLRTRGVNLFAVLFDQDSFGQSGQESVSGDRGRIAIAQASLLDIGAHCLTLSRGDDLISRFNS